MQVLVCAEKLLYTELHTQLPPFHSCDFLSFPLVQDGLPPFLSFLFLLMALRVHVWYMSVYTGVHRCTGPGTCGSQRLMTSSVASLFTVLTGQGGH